MRTEFKAYADNYERCKKCPVAEWGGLDGSKDYFFGCFKTIKKGFKASPPDDCGFTTNHFILMGAVMDDKFTDDIINLLLDWLKHEGLAEALGLRH